MLWEVQIKVLISLIPFATAIENKEIIACNTETPYKVVENKQGMYFDGETGVLEFYTGDHKDDTFITICYITVTDFNRFNIVHGFRQLNEIIVQLQKINYVDKYTPEDIALMEFILNTKMDINPEFMTKDNEKDFNDIFGEMTEAMQGLTSIIKESTEKCNDMICLAKPVILYLIETYPEKYSNNIPSTCDITAALQFIPKEK